MSDTLLVATRKGLFTVSRKRRQWAISAVDFLGDNVSICLADCRDGQCYAALDHGHFGVKLHRSKATGWEEIAAPTYPPKPEGHEETDMHGISFRPTCFGARSRIPAWVPVELEF